MPEPTDNSTARTRAAFGRALSEHRAARGLTQAQLAERSGLTQPIISRFENGIQTPTLTHLDALGGALGLTAAQLVEAGTTERDRSPNP